MVAKAPAQTCGKTSTNHHGKTPAAEPSSPMPMGARRLARGVTSAAGANAPAPAKVTAPAAATPMATRAIRATHPTATALRVARPTHRVRCSRTALTLPVWGMSAVKFA